MPAFLANVLEPRFARSTHVADVGRAHSRAGRARRCLEDALSVEDDHVVEALIDAM
jgi:hypothetical protein